MFYKNRWHTSIRSAYRELRHESQSRERSVKWESVVGIEVHAQIQTKSKMFSGSLSKFGSPANSLANFFDCATPGTLPVLNKKCVEAGVLTALALNCSINVVSEFDRKHYFYADMPAGYQITQQRIPLATSGYLNFVMAKSSCGKPVRKTSAIKQLQLEQDSGKSLHNELASGSLIDLNRAGVGLMEIVFEPDISDGEEAAALTSELIGVLEALGTCNCKMEDANVSVRKVGEALGTRTEIKNLNSIRGVSRAINYEISRQIRILEQGGKVANETRSFDSQLRKTLSMRDKETKQDYRYMPEPNLPRLHLLELDIDPPHLQKLLPTLPDAKRTALMDRYKLSLETAAKIVNGGYLKFFETVMKARPDLPEKKVIGFLLTDLLNLLNQEDKSIEQCSITAEKFAEIVHLRETGVISHTTSQVILCLQYQGDPREAKQIVEQEGLAIVTDLKEIETACKLIIEGNKKAVADFRSGKVKVFAKLATLLHQSNNGRFDMGIATRILRKILDEK